MVVPDHKTLRPGTLRQILNEAGLTLEQLKELF
ncbi:MAG: type II toxin-antitoxin system HicA family toxin [Acidobacteriota bacterium]